MSSIWKREVFIENNQIVSLKQLTKVGDSYSLILPKEWVKVFARRDERGRYWVKIKYTGENEKVDFIPGIKPLCPDNSAARVSNICDHSPQDMYGYN